MSLIVTGLPPMNGKDDKNLFVDLCSSELKLTPDAVSVKRLGHAQPDKIQPLLVYCKQADEAKQIIKSAKMLRRSSDPLIRNSVFINHNLTKAEAAAAYQMRVQRRLVLQQRKDNSNADGSRTRDRPVAEHGSYRSSTVSDQSQSQLNPNATFFLPSEATSIESTA